MSFWLEEHYEGETLNGLRDGFGKLTTKRVNRYFPLCYSLDTGYNFTFIGTFSEGVIKHGTITTELSVYTLNSDGTGEAKYKNGNKYNGRIKVLNIKLYGSKNPHVLDFWKHGKGTMTYKNGNVYEGEWFEGNITNSKAKYTDGRIFEDKFENDKPVKGKITYLNGDVYEGDWCNLKITNGRAKFVDGSVYVGDFIENKMNVGKMIYADGNVYSGQWENNVRVGKGIFYNKDRQGYDISGEWIFDDFLVIEKTPTVTSVWRKGVEPPNKEELLIDFLT